MEYRNAILNEVGGIDCEIDHPDFGWIPFHATPNDPEQHGRDLYDRITRHGELNDVFNSDAVE